MRIFPMNGSRARAAMARIGASFAAVAATALIAGCGNNYRPVVIPVGTSGPPAEATSYAVVVSTTGTSTAGIVTIIDYSGDTVMDETLIGDGPTAFTLDELGGTGYTINSDYTISNFSISTSLQAKNLGNSTVPPGAQIVNLMPPSSGLWATDLNGNVVDIFSGSPEDFVRAVQVTGTMPMFIAGAPTTSGEREYAISQNVTSTVACNSPRSVVTPGAATPIEISTETFDPAIAVGICPVYAVSSSDQQRLFVLNRGDDTVTVINMKNNTLDTGCPPPTGCTNQNAQTYYTHPALPLSLTAVTALNNITPGSGTPPNGTAGMGTTAGPVYAEYNAARSQLVVANYDGGTVSMIDVSLDEYGNDSSTFGTTYTVSVGNTSTPNPASVTVLYDGSKAYTANQNDGTDDGTVTVVNLSTHTAEKTITVVGHPRTVVNTQNSEYSKVYVASPDSPYITIIESTPTVTDVVDTTVLVEGTVVDVRVNTQNGVSGNSNYSSRVPGYGQPCNLPGSAYTGSLAACQAIP